MLKKNDSKKLWRAIHLSLIGLILNHNILEMALANSSASTTARITATVIKSISIEKVADMDFGAIYQGSSEDTITSEMKTAAKFIVHGEPGKAFSIVLPETVTLAPTESSSAKDSISVSKFTSFPHQNGQMDRTGKTNLAVGATREKIQKQQTGDYAGQFTITVTYQ